MRTMPRNKSNGTKDSSARLGFEAKLWLFAKTALRDSAFLHTGGKLQVMTERRGDLRNNMDAAETERSEAIQARRPQPPFLKYISESAQLVAAIRSNLKGLGYAF